MNNWPDYRKATNMAYEVSAKMNPFRISADIFKIIDSYSNIAIHSYTEIAAKFNMSLEEFVDSFSSEYGFTISNHTGNYEIWYNDTLDTTKVRFTLAHELGHILLGHEKDDEVSRKEASCFARNLLIPTPVIDELGIVTAHDIASVFDVSAQMAEVSANHLASDKYYIQEDLYSNLKERAAMYIYGYSPMDFLGNPYI